MNTRGVEPPRTPLILSVFTHSRNAGFAGGTPTGAAGVGAGVVLGVAATAADDVGAAAAVFTTSAVASWRHLVTSDSPANDRAIRSCSTGWR